MEEKQLSEDLKVIRSMIERTHKRFDPGAPMIITWGLMCLVGLPATHFLMAHKIYRWINPMWLTLYVIGISLSFFFGYKLNKREKMQGVVSYIGKQISWVWFILIGNAILWSLLGHFMDFVGGPGFLYAMMYGMALCVMGILYSKEWLWGESGYSSAC